MKKPFPMKRMKHAKLSAIKFAPRITKVRVEQSKAVGDLSVMTAVEFTTDGLSEAKDIADVLTAATMVPMPIVKP